MKIVFFSDTHTLHQKVILPEADMAIFCGDCMGSGYKAIELMDFLLWFSSQSFKYKVFIAGNHDRYIEDKPEKFRDMLQEFPDLIYLENEGVTIEGLKIWGTPNSKEFFNWAFNNTEEELVRIFSWIPSDVDILVSHAPQFGVLDFLRDGRRVGEMSLGRKMENLEELKIHAFGHIHEGYGTINKNGLISINCSLVDEDYNLVNKPIRVEI